MNWGSRKNRRESEDIMWNTIKERLKSPVTLAAIVGQIVTILLMVGAISTGAGDTVNNVAAGVIQLLVLFGVLNNPTDKANF
jgi:uncharacterized membrane protein